jgi:hypothetical protein
VLDRFLDFLQAPLSGRAARAVLILTAGVCFGFVLLVLLSNAAGDHTQPGAEHHDGRRRAVSARSDRDPAVARARQDPQDQPGSAAARAARGELRTHRALQHVPYRGAGVKITLVGARHGRAMLSVRGGDLATERRGWRGFLRRFGDDGGAYIPIFAAGRSRAVFDHQVDHQVDQWVGLPVGATSCPTRLIRRHTAECALPIFKRSLRHSEVGT